MGTTAVLKLDILIMAREGDSMKKRELEEAGR
jgi:hypothetical protein